MVIRWRLWMHWKGARIEQGADTWIDPAFAFELAREIHCDRRLTFSGSDGERSFTGMHAKDLCDHVLGGMFGIGAQQEASRAVEMQISQQLERGHRERLTRYYHQRRGTRPGRDGT